MLDGQVQELSIEVEKLGVGNSITAICVYTGDLAHVNSRQIVDSFIEAHCTQIYDKKSGSIGKMSCGRSRTSSGSSQISSQSNGSSQQDYLTQLVTNVVQMGGGKQLMPLIQRKGKSLLSLTRVVKGL